MPKLLDIFGQDAALAALARAGGGARRPHAFIFAGPEGVGRRTTALELGKLLLCPQPRPIPVGQAAGLAPAGTAGKSARRFPDLPEDFSLHVPCEQCPSCLSAQAGTNPDLHLIYKELGRFHDDEKVRERKMQDLGIDVIRQFLIAPAGRRPAGGRGKVFVVQGADLMNAAAQNALLKTLEEPPPDVTIILIAVAAEELLPTTRSRCQVVRFGALPVELVSDKLAQAGVAPAEARFWALLTDGSLGRSRRLAKEKLYDFKRELVEMLAGMGSVPDSALPELLFKQTKKLADRFTGRDELLAATLAGRQAGEIVLGLLASVYRDALAVACGLARPLAHADQPDAIAKIAGRFAPAVLADIMSQLARYEQLLWRNVNPKILWDNLAVTCASGAALEV